MTIPQGERLSAFASKMKRGASAMGPSPKQKFASELNMWNDLRNSVTLFMSDTEPKAALLSSLVDEANRKGPYGFVTEGDAVLPTGFEISNMQAHLYVIDASQILSNRTQNSWNVSPFACSFFCERQAQLHAQGRH